jgi:hypothetical protein
MSNSVPPLRPPSVPLVVCDPYLSVWSAHDRLTDGSTQHWTGKKQSLFGMTRIDGVPYGFMGPVRPPLAAMAQLSLDVLPARTIYTFMAAGIQLTVTFLTSALLHDLDVLARPLTYVAFEAVSVDGTPHEVAVYIDIGADWTVNVPQQRVVWGRHQIDGADALWMGTTEQAVLDKAGDDLRIDWGYLYTAANPAPDMRNTLGSAHLTRKYFADTATLPLNDDTDMPRPAETGDSLVVSAWAFALGTVASEPVSRHLVIAYDDRFSIEYMQRKLRPYWRRNGADAASLIQTALDEYDAIRQRCETFDSELMADLTATGGERYARLAALAFRQCIAAHKLVVDHDGTVLFFSKENFSNGCIATVDIAYPSSPFFLLFNPALLEAQLRPVLDYAASPGWPFPFAPHDLGVYPLANGQVYGGGEASEEDQMPVEECGNMLLMVAALCNVQQDAAFAASYWPLLAQWADYLRDKGLDPENQLCTDDFAGHLAHNVNLSLKAILAIAAYAQLCQRLGHDADAATYRASAEAMAGQWLRMADDGDHYRLTFDRPGTWSQKYNLVWDRLLNLALFPPQVAEKELAYYKTKVQRYGLPLDSRAAYTKLDWTVWSASLSASAAEMEPFIAAIYAWLNTTESRVPLNDWYDTLTGQQMNMQARSVVGGVFILMLRDPARHEKWRAYKESDCGLV